MSEIATSAIRAVELLDTRLKEVEEERDTAMEIAERAARLIRELREDQ